MTRLILQPITVQTRDTTRPVFTKEIAYIYSEDKYTVLHTFDGHKHLVDHTLDQLEKSLDRKEFFRISRGCIVNIASVHHASKFFSGRLALTVSPECEKAKTVSRTRTNEFLKWLDGIY